MSSRLHRSFSRRGFLKTLGAAAALAPFVPILEAEAQVAAPPKRLVLFFTPHATHWPSWMAANSAGNNVVLGPILQPLQPYLQKLAFVRGLGFGTQAEDLPMAHSQGFVELWTGSRRNADTFASSISVDQYIANQLQPPTKFKTLQLGVQCLGSAGGNSRMIYAGSSQPIDPEQNPQNAFSFLFGGGAPGGMAMQPNPVVLAQNKSVLDLVLGELTALQPRLGMGDQQKLSAHAQAIRDLEVSLAAPVQSCTAPTAPAGTTDIQAGVPDMPTQLKQQMDIMVAALACDLTRVASMQVSFGDNDNLFPYAWLGLQEGHHSLTHDDPTSATVNGSLDMIYTWYSQQFLYFLQKLDSVKEGSGTLLDNTLVVWGSELGTYHDHMSWPVPFVLAGFSAGGLKANQYIDYGTMFVQHNRLLVSICNAMGLPNVTTFGAMDVGSGPLPGLFG
jgi:Protein of unknown function (DUF1552)